MVSEPPAAVGADADRRADAARHLARELLAAAPPGGVRRLRPDLRGRARPRGRLRRGVRRRATLRSGRAGRRRHRPRRAHPAARAGDVPRRGSRARQPRAAALRRREPRRRRERADDRAPVGPGPFRARVRPGAPPRRPVGHEHAQPAHLPARQRLPCARARRAPISSTSCGRISTSIRSRGRAGGPRFARTGRADTATWWPPRQTPSTACGPSCPIGGTTSRSPTTPVTALVAVRGRRSTALRPGVRDQPTRPS